MTAGLLGGLRGAFSLAALSSLASVSSSSLASSLPASSSLASVASAARPTDARYSVCMVWVHADMKYRSQSIIMATSPWDIAIDFSH